MKNFLLFYGQSYYPSGGFMDYKGMYDDAEAAILAGKRACSESLDDRRASPESGHGWWHVVDIRTFKIVDGEDGGEKLTD